jgi:hypothetical protein
MNSRHTNKSHISNHIFFIVLALVLSFGTVSCVSSSRRIGDTPPQPFIAGLDSIVLSGNDCFLYGEVCGGAYAVSDGMKLLDLINAAGGLVTYADPTCVSIFRNGHRIVTVDINKIRKGEIPDPVIQPKDFIFVPVLGFQRKRFDRRVKELDGSRGHPLQIQYENRDSQK